MRIKIDENLAAAHKRILENAGHNVTDVYERRVVDEVDLQVLEGCLAVADETRTRVRRWRQD